MTKIPRFILTTEKEVEKYGLTYKILTSGVDLSEFNKNSIMLWNHCDDDVIGTWKEVMVESDRISAMPDFDLDEDSQTIMNKVLKGTLKTASVGLKIVEKVISADTNVILITKSILKEASIVALPANTECEVEDSTNDYILFSMDGTKLDSESELKKYLKMEEVKEEVLTFSNQIETIEEQVVEQVVINIGKIVEVEYRNEEELLNLKSELDSIKLELSSSLELKNSEIESLKMELNSLKDLKLGLENEVEKFKSEKINDLLKFYKQKGTVNDESEKKFLDLKLTYDNLKSVLESLPSNGGKVSSIQNMFKTDSTKVKSYEQYSSAELRKMAKEDPSLYKQVELDYVNKFSK